MSRTETAAAWQKKRGNPTTRCGEKEGTVVLYDERVIALEMGPSHWYALYHKVIPNASACDCNSFTIERWLLG
jgi:hypothetical protein